jgi:hypothetical protein
VPKVANDTSMEVVMGTPFFISPSDLFARLGRADAPLIFDVRRPEIVEAADDILPTARIRHPLRRRRRGARGA